MKNPLDYFVFRLPSLRLPVIPIPVAIGALVIVVGALVAWFFFLGGEADQQVQQLPDTPLPASAAAPAPTVAPPIVISGALLPTFEPTPSGMAALARERSGRPAGPVTPNFPPAPAGAAGSLTPLAQEFPNFGTGLTGPTATPTRTPEPTAVPAPLPTATAVPTVNPASLYPELPAGLYLWQTLLDLQNLGGYVQDFELWFDSGGPDFATDRSVFKIVSAVENPSAQAGSMFVDRQSRQDAESVWQDLDTSRFNFLTYDGETFYRHHPGSSGWIGESMRDARRFRLCELLECADPSAITDAIYFSGPELLGRKFIEISARARLKDQSVCPAGVGPQDCALDALFLIDARDGLLDSVYGEFRSGGSSVRVSIRLSAHGRVYGLSGLPSGGEPDTPARVIAVTEAGGSSGRYDVVVGFDQPPELNGPEGVYLGAAERGRMALRGVALGGRALVFDSSGLESPPSDCSDPSDPGRYLVDRFVYEDGSYLGAAIDLFAPSELSYCAPNQDETTRNLGDLTDPSAIPTPVATAVPTATPLPAVIDRGLDDSREERTLRFVERELEFMGPGDYRYSFDSGSIWELAQGSVPPALRRYLDGDGPRASMVALDPIDGMPYMVLVFLDDRAAGETMESFSHRQYDSQTQNSASSLTNLSISTTANQQGYSCLEYRYDTRWRHREYMVFCGRERDVVQFVMGAGSFNSETERLFSDTLGKTRFLDGSDDLEEE